MITVRKIGRLYQIFPRRYDRLVDVDVLSFQKVKHDLGFQRCLSSTSLNHIFVARRKSVTDNLTVQQPFEYSGNQVKPRSNTKVLRDLKKVNKKTKRDTTDSTSKDNLAILETKESLRVYNERVANRYKAREGDRTIEPTEIPGHVNLEQILNPSQLIDTFLFSKSRPVVTIPNLEIIYQTAEGNGIGIIPKSMYVTPLMETEDDIFNMYTVIQVPKTLVGDRVKVKLALHNRYYAEGVLIEVLPSTRNNGRNDKLIVCDKFHECSGCQLQMLNYENQLKFKESVIEKAYKFFFPDLEKFHDQNIEFGTVYGSPMEYSYRNKLTPHFKYPRDKRDPEVEIKPLNIGIQHVDPTKGIVDLDHCDIATQVLNEELASKRAEVLNNLDQVPDSKKGKQQTLFLRESVRVNNDSGEYSRVCISNPRKLVITEKVEDFVFQFEPSGFFQNNNYILPTVLDYLRYHIGDDQSYRYLIDTYCGSGLFGIALSKLISSTGKIFGIELSQLSIKYATHNAKLNNLNVPERIQFIEGDTESLFKNQEFIDSGIRGNKSIVIMDPSRKGSNLSFMRQLYEFKPKLIIYISCNVFTQARDLSNFFEIQESVNTLTKYRVKDLVGFDFFPQTKHVETIAILELIE